MLENDSIATIQRALRLVEILGIDSFDLALLARISRAKLGLSLDEAAEKIALKSESTFTRQLLSQIEDGKNKTPQKAKLLAMAKFYGKGFAQGLKELGLLHSELDSIFLEDNPKDI